MPRVAENIKVPLDRPMLTSKDVAELLGKTPASVTSLCDRRHLRYVKVGTSRRFPPAWLEEDLAKMAQVQA